MKKEIERLMKAALVRRIKARMCNAELIYKFEGGLIRGLYNKWRTL